MKVKIFFICFILFYFFPSIVFAVNCSFENRNIDSADSKFLKDSIFALSLQLTNESFNSNKAVQARSKMFDMVFDTPYWNRRFAKKNEFTFFWNWVRFQYWGLLQQQALLKEDQGFLTTNNKALADSYASIYKLPIYPQPVTIINHVCRSLEKNIYPCDQQILKAEVVFSPALACSKSMNLNSLKFQYYITKTPAGWAILDVKFKGRRLILDSFNEYDDLMNKYGNERAINYLKKLIHKIFLVTPDKNSRQSGSLKFYQAYKIDAPTYPINY